MPERCVATVEIEKKDGVGGNVEIRCDHCGLSESFFRQGDKYTVWSETQTQINIFLKNNCKRLAEKGIDPDAIDHRFFPRPQVTEL